MIPCSTRRGVCTCHFTSMYTNLTPVDHVPCAFGDCLFFLCLVVMVSKNSSCTVAKSFLLRCTSMTQLWSTSSGSSQLDCGSSHSRRCTLCAECLGPQSVGGQNLEWSCQEVWPWPGGLVNPMRPCWMSTQSLSGELVSMTRWPNNVLWMFSYFDCSIQKQFGSKCFLPWNRRSLFLPQAEI